MRILVETNILFSALVFPYSKLAEALLYRPADLKRGDGSRCTAGTALC